MIKLFKRDELRSFTWFIKIENSVLVYTNTNLILHIPLKYLLSEEPKMPVNGYIKLEDWESYKVHSAKSMKVSDSGEFLEIDFKNKELSLPILSEDQAQAEGLSTYPNYKVVIPTTHDRPASYIQGFNTELAKGVQLALGGMAETYFEFFGIGRVMKIVNTEFPDRFGILCTMMRNEWIELEEDIQTEIEAQKALL